MGTASPGSPPSRVPAGGSRCRYVAHMLSPGLKVLGLAVFSYTSVPQKTPSFVGVTCSVPTRWLTCPLVLATPLISSYASSSLVIIPFPPPPSSPRSDDLVRCKGIPSSASSTPPPCPWRFNRRPSRRQSHSPPFTGLDFSPCLIATPVAPRHSF